MKTSEVLRKAKALIDTPEKFVVFGWAAALVDFHKGQLPEDVSEGISQLKARFDDAIAAAEEAEA